MKFMALVTFGVASLCAVLVGCGERHKASASPPPEVYSIRVEPASLRLQAGDSAQLAAEASDLHGEAVGGTPFSFESADQQIARVTPTGFVTAPGATGSTEVRVAGGGRVSAVPVVVSAGPAARTDVLEAPARDAAAGESLGTIRLRMTDAYGNALAERAVTWRVVQGDGRLIDAATRTNADGSVEATWQAGRVTGTQVLEFASEGLAPMSFTAVAHAGPPARLRLQLTNAADSEPPRIPAGRTSQLVARVVDALDNPVPQAEVILDALAACGFDGGHASTDASGATTPLAWTPRAARVCRITARVRNTDISATLETRVIREAPASGRQ